MAGLVETVWKQFCEDRRNSTFGHDTFLDGRTYSQNFQIQFINKAYDVVNILDNYYSDPYLIYIVTTKCNRLLRFKINSLGLFTVSTVPVFGGNNTPYHKPIVKPLKNQLSCLD